MVKRTPLGLLLAAGFAALLALLVAAVLLGVWRASNTFGRLEQVVAQFNVQASLAYRMRATVRERMLTLWKMSLAEDPFDRDEYYQDFIRLGGQFIAARDNFIKAPLDEAEKTLVARLSVSAERGAEVNREAARQMLDSRGLVLRQQLLHEALPAQDSVLAIIDELILIQAEKSREARRSVAAENEATIYAILALMTAALLLGGVLAGLVTFRYRAMLDDIRHASAELDSANRELEGRIEERTRQLSEANAKLEEMAHHDALTGLANRRLLTTQMQVLLAHAARAQERLGVLFIDLDGFKEVNDRLGHDAGDELLVEVAEVLRSTTRQADLAARVGGDEFVVVLGGVLDGEQARAVAEKIIAAWLPHAMRYESVGPVTLSIGISIYPDDADAVELLLHHADNAMYAVKRGGKNGCRLYRAAA